MYNRRTRAAAAFNYRARIRRRRVIFAIITLAAVGVIFAAVRPLSLNLGTRAGTGNQRREIQRLWENGDYLEVFDLCRAALVSRPTDYFLLTMTGFSAFQTGVSRINSLDAAYYFDESVLSLRKATLLKNAANDGRLYYVLGKAYWYKGESFADLSVKYLEKARELSYNASDIPEFLGMAYASLGDYRRSVAAFAEALNPQATGQTGDMADGRADGGSQEQPGLLLLSIARSYLALNEYETARAYLHRCIAVSPDSNIARQAKLLLSEALFNTGDTGGAIRLLAETLEEFGENAEIRFRLGELYFRQGDTARARAEWRLAVRADPAHAGARLRLSL